MILKPRCRSHELLILQSLHGRLDFELKDEQYYSHLQKGFEGEDAFDRLLASFNIEALILNDLLLQHQGTYFQLDSLLISHDKIYLFEVKNYEGDFYIQNGIWYSIPNLEIKNPLLQLQRSEALLRRFLQALGYSYKVEAHTIFINPEFALLQAPLNLPIVLPTQLKRFLKKIAVNQGKLSANHTQLAEKLLAEHIRSSPFSLLPTYNYEQLEKGILCSGCGEMITNHVKSKLIYSGCGKFEGIDSAILRSAKEYMLLFPNRDLSTNTLHEWCKIIPSKKTIRRVLAQNFVVKGQKKYTTYVNP